MKTRILLYLSIVFSIALNAACAPQALAEVPAVEASPTNVAPVSIQEEEPTQSATALPTVTELVPVTGHTMIPSESVPPPGKWVDDVESSGTGREGRAPYGDSYKLNRFERPFLKDMTYVSDIDIRRFGLSDDTDWYYVSIQLIGNDPNNSLGINYGAEIDLDADGFGDFIVWARPPYTDQWDTSTVQVLKDANFDSGGLSGLKADAAPDGNGYETMVFDGSVQNTDPDLAWVRLVGGRQATIQLAFKKSLTGPAFLLGVVSDSGLKDVTKYDYADHFNEAEAGSSIKGNQYYPLGSVYGVDNTCWEPYGIQTTGYEPKLCPTIVQVQPTKKGSSGESPAGPVGGPVDGPTACPVQECGEGNVFNTSSCQCEPIQ